MGSEGAKDGSLKVSQSEINLPKAPFILLGQYKVPLVKYKFLKPEIGAKLSMNRWELMIKVSENNRPDMENSCSACTYLKLTGNSR